MMVLSALLVFPFGIWYFGGFSFKGDREIFIAMCLAAGLAFLRVVWLVVTYPVLGLDLENAAFELRDGLLAKRVVDQGSLADLRVGVFRWHVYSRHRYGVDTHFAVIAYSGRGYIVLKTARERQSAEDSVVCDFSEIPRADVSDFPVRNSAIWF